MTNQQHPITPPPELVGEWLCSEDYLSDASTFSSMTITSSRLQNVATQAACWGADQELEACCQWTAERTTQWLDGTWPADALRAARRPKPPSLAEQAMEAQQRAWNGSSTHADWELIRRALERLQELEKGNE